MPFTIVRNDITRMHADAIVNAANSALAPGGGVCGAIFSAAGYDRLDRACRAIGHCDVGSAVITDGFDLPARYVIHAVGPIWRGGQTGEEDLLRSCYRSALELAVRHGCASIAFPLISSGIYGYPKEQALQVAVEAIRSFLQEHDLQVWLVVFDQAAVQLGQERLGRIRRFIDDHYVQEHRVSRMTNDAVSFTGQLLEQAQMPAPCVKKAEPMRMEKKAAKRSLSDLVRNLDESFSQMLLRLIDEKDMTDVEVYKRANLDRKLFSKVRKADYNPSKPTAVALAIALRLNLDETRDLLRKAGFALSRSSKFDVIVEYFITEGIYDIYEINEALFAFDQRLLGA